MCILTKGKKNYICILHISSTIMKKIFTILIFTCLLGAASAKVRTVNNNAGGPGQFSNLQTALDSSASGDTIYVHGSATSYGNVTIKKQITLIGTGSNPNKANTLVSKAGYLYLDTVANISGASGSRITGFTLNAVYGYAGAGGSRNVAISRNNFLAGATAILVTGSGWTFENNILVPSIKANNNSNIIIRNNVFNGAKITNSNQATTLVSNNVFIGTSNATAFTTVSNALVANNIFYGSSPKGTSVDNNTFSNNITYQTSYDTIPFGTNTGSGNFLAKDPEFTNVPAKNFSYSDDFTLKATSIGKNAGTDGTDIGIFGGANPFVDMTGAPAIPQLKSMNILNPVIPVGDSLRVVIKANKQN